MLTRFFFRIIPTVLAMSVGLVTLLSFLVPDDALATLVPNSAALTSLRAWFVSWASILAAFALIAGFFNVLSVHGARIAAQRHNWPYSVALLLGVGVVLVAAVVDGLAAGRVDPGGRVTRWIFDNVIVQLELAVAALIAFFLAFAAYRALRRPSHASEARAAAAARPAWATLIFLVAALVVLVRTAHFVSDPGVVDLQREVARLVDTVALGGTRGLLIGVALGTIATGLRVLAGVDRPHSE